MLKVSNTLIESLITHAYKFPQPSAQEYFDRHPLRRISKLIVKSKCLLYEGKGTQTPTVLFSLETLSLGGASKKMTKIEVPSQGFVIPLLYHIQVQYIHVCYVPPKVLFKRSVHRDGSALNYEHFIHAQT